MDEYDRIRSIYDFVRNDIPLGYSATDAMPASRVLKDGYGQCNTKAILLMALLRAVGVPCRVNAFYVRKELQRYLMNDFIYRRTPDLIFHSWVEICRDGEWCSLEGCVVDDAYLAGVKALSGTRQGPFMGFAIAVKDMGQLENEWQGKSTWIQSESIERHIGVYDSPDAMLKKNAQGLNPIRLILYRIYGRRAINRRAKKIRNI